jgi:shikimate dehydrogenase
MPERSMDTFNNNQAMRPIHFHFSPPPKHLFGILGNPLGHSLSPLLHTWAFARMKYPGAYFSWEKTPKQLADVLGAVRALPVAGASVTIPHKQAIMPFLDAVSARAQAAGAVNTLYWQNGALTGDNTDVPGFLAPLGPAPIPAAMVLGAGGAARAVLAALAERGTPRAIVAARDMRKAAALADDFACRLIAWEDRVAALADLGSGLVVNATPLGMLGPRCDASPLPPHAWPRDRDLLAYDLVYNPQRTRFLEDAAASGARTQDGLGLFVAQAMEQFHLWTGMTPPKDEARAVVLDALRVAPANSLPPGAAACRGQDASQSSSRETRAKGKAPSGGRM